MKLNNLRIPSFGDYTISHPKVNYLDMRFIKPAAKLVYTTDNAFFVRKGPNVRDHKFGQYQVFCSEIISDSFFKGKNFSFGDGYIHGCANKKEKTGNLTTWKKVGTNHHMEKVVEDISSYSSFLDIL